MIDFFKKIFRKKQKEENIIMESETNNSNTQQTKKKFEVEIYDKVSVGEPPYDRIELQKVMMEKPVIIEASSKKDLDEFGEKLELCQQTFKIVRVIEEQPITKQPVSDIKPKQNIPLTNNPVNIQPIDNSTIKESKVEICSESIIKKSKPRFFKVGDVELKDDNGKIYQKQWIRLTDIEASNLRVINDKTNAIFNLNGKHIEMKKWILVDSTDEEQEEIVLGSEE
jgi:hypothetical protein